LCNYGVVSETDWSTAMTTNPFPQVPFPAGAVKADWHDLHSLNAFRYFEGAHRVVDRRDDLPSSQDVLVYIAGTQALDGTVEREIVVHQLHADEPITPQQARQLARALVAAADDIDRWTR
jgi:hypothetical protein